MSEGASRSGDERRCAARRAIPAVEATLRSPGDVKVLDVSVFGMAIEAPEALLPGERLCLELRHGRQVANVEVAVRWSSVGRVARERGTLVPVSRAGVEFADIYREQSGGIWDCILVRDDEGA
jgi:hypothetical protein